MKRSLTLSAIFIALAVPALGAPAVTAEAAKIKITKDANAGRWKDVIADGDSLSKTGGLNASYRLLVAQAYYQLHDAKACMAYIRFNGLDGKTAKMLLQRCAKDAGASVN